MNVPGIKVITVLALMTLSMFSCGQKKPEPMVNIERRTAGVQNDNGSPSEPDRTKADLTREWNGRVGDIRFLWDGKDFTVRLMSGQQVGLFSRFAETDYGLREREPESSGCLINYFYRPLAIAGNFVGFRYETGLLCGAINTSSSGYATVELVNVKRQFSKPRESDREVYRDVSLSDLFPEGDIFTGCMANHRISKDISKLIDQGKIPGPPTNLAELKKLFERFNSDFLEGKFVFDSQALEEFVLHHIEGDRVSIWISLVPNSRAFQGLNDHLEVFMPIPKHMVDSLSLANSREQGFLMKDADNLVGTSSAKFEFIN